MVRSTIHTAFKLVIGVTPLLLASAVMFLLWQAPSSEAIRAAEEATKREPGSAQAWFALGVTLGSANRVTDAVDAYRKSLSIDPRNVDALNNLGDLYRRSGNKPAAAEALDQALAIDPNNARAALNRALVHIEDGDFRGAIPRLEKAMAGLGQIPALDYLFARTYLQLEDVPSAKPFVDRFRTAGASPAGSLELATLAADQGEFALAVELLSAIPDSRQSEDMKLRLGQAWFGLDQLEKARETFASMVEARPGNDRALTWLGHAERALGNLAVAKQSLEASLKINASSAEAWTALAGIHVDDGDAERGLEFADRALTLSSNNPAALLTRASALLRLERPKEAAEALTRIPESSAEFQQSLFLLSRAYRLLGDTEKSRAALARFQELERENKSRPSMPARRR